MIEATQHVESVIDQEIVRDQVRLESLTLRCAECRRHGPAKDGLWHLLSGLVMCDACWNAEAHE